MYSICCIVKILLYGNNLNFIISWKLSYNGINLILSTYKIAFFTSLLSKTRHTIELESNSRLNGILLISILSLNLDDITVKLISSLITSFMFGSL